MNCFDWQNRSSDYLDGTLIGAIKQEADEHLDSCEACTERHKHYRMILTTLSNRPRAGLPIPVRKAPLTVGLPRLELTTSRWAAIPWYLRTSLEAAGIILLTLAGISLGPKARSLYEKKMERSLNDFSQPFSDPARNDMAYPAANNANATRLAADPAGDEFASEGDDDEDAGDDEDTGDAEETASVVENIRVGKSDVWRFILKTDSPAEMRKHVVEVLTALRSPEDQQNADGIRAPGGIQFDLILPQTAIPKLKTQLNSLAPPAPEGLADTPAGETFTWYKVKSKRKIPEGMTRVVIWISQM